VAKILNAQLASVIALVIFVIYWFILASIFYGFPPDIGMVKVPSTYTTLLGIGLIILGVVIGSFTFSDAKNKMLPLTKWGKIWILSNIIFLVSFSIFVFSNFIIGDLEITFFSSIVWLACSFLSAISYRRLDSKMRQQESNGKEKQAIQNQKVIQ